MEFEAKQRAIAQLIDGQPVDDSERVAVCIKGVINGFPATLECFMTGWPWSVSYSIQTNLVEGKEIDPEEHANINIIPRMGRGFGMAFLSHIFLFEAKGASVGDKKLEKKLIFSFDNREPALRFIRYPEVPETLLHMEQYCKMRELVVRTDTGVYLEQAYNFKELDMDVCQATFRYLGDLSQVIANAFM